MTKGNRPRQRLFLSFQYASVWRLFLFSRNIKPPKMRIWIAYFTALVPFGLPCGLHNPKVIAQGWKARWTWFFWLVACSRRSDERRMARVESREKKIASRIEREIIDSIARQRPCFYCQGRRPTQLIDPQLIMYFVFTILSLLNKWTLLNILVTRRSITCPEKNVATGIFWRYFNTCIHTIKVHPHMSFFHITVIWKKILIYYNINNTSANKA